MSAISLGVTSGKSWANQVLSSGALHECTDGLQSCGYSRIRFREAVLVHAPYVGEKVYRERMQVYIPGGPEKTVWPDACRRICLSSS